MSRFMRSYRGAIRSNMTWTSGGAAALPAPVEAPDGVWSGGEGHAGSSREGADGGGDGAAGLR